jgi:hypothetical protein
MGGARDGRGLRRGVRVSWGPSRYSTFLRSATTTPITTTTAMTTNQNVVEMIPASIGVSLRLRGAVLPEGMVHETARANR